MWLAATNGFSLGFKKQHKFGKCVPKALRSYLQVPTLMLHHYLEVNPIRLGGKIRMALGAQHASPCAPGRRRARIAGVCCLKTRLRFSIGQIDAGSREYGKRLFPYYLR